MTFRSLPAVFLGLAWAHAATAQVNQADRFEILRVLIADNAAARVVMPLGNAGVRLSDTGLIEEDRLQEELRKNGRAVTLGQVVEITAIEFEDDSIRIELDGGGDRGRGILDRIQVGLGNRTTPIREQDETPPKGSRIDLRFENGTPGTMTVDELRAYLSPVLDFNKQNFMDSGVESLPLEFQEAVRDKKVLIGMDWSTVTLARGRPHNKFWEATPEGIEQEIWMYDKPGFGADFLTFEDGILVGIVER
jgi:hypothetical protein